MLLHVFNISVISGLASVKRKKQKGIVKQNRRKIKSYKRNLYNYSLELCNVVILNSNFPLYIDLEA